MSRFVVTGGDDPLLQLLNLCSSLTEDSSWVQTHVVNNRVTASPELLRILLPYIPKLLTQEQGLAHVTVIIFLLQQLRTEATFPELVQNTTESLMSSVEAAGLRLQVLATLYDSFESKNPLLIHVFRNICTYAKSVNLTHLIIPHLQHLQKTVDGWEGVSKEQKAQLYWVAYGLVEQPALRTDLLLHTLENSEGAGSRVEQSLLEIMKLTNAHQLLKVLQLPVVSGLTSAVGALGRCISQGSVSKFEEFERNNASFFADQEIDKEKMMSFLRIFAVCELAEQSPVFSFQQAAELIQVPKSEVDFWVVQAISSGLLEARIDQAEEKVQVMNTHHRFTSTNSTQSLIATFGKWETQLAQVAT